MNKLTLSGLFLFGTVITIGCSDSDDAVSPTTWEIGNPTKTDYPEDYYTGGLLGTTTVNSSTAFKQPTKSVEDADMMTAFNEGEYEKQCRNRLDAGCCCKCLVLVNVDLQDLDSAIIFLCQSFEHGSHSLTRTTPCGVEIDNDRRNSCIVVASEILLIIFDILHNLNVSMS